MLMQDELQKSYIKIALLINLIQIKSTKPIEVLDTMISL